MADLKPHMKQITKTVALFCIMLSTACTPKKPSSSENDSDTLRTTPLTETMPKPVKVDSAGIYWIPKNHTLEKGLVKFIMNNTVITDTGMVNNVGPMPVTLFSYNFYGKKITIVLVNEPKLSTIGSADPKTSQLVLNKAQINKIYHRNKSFLDSSRLSNYIASLEDFWECILMQELWHLYNESSHDDFARLEYFSEFASLDSKAGDFYLFYKYTQAAQSTKNEPRYALVSQHYRWAFEIQPSEKHIPSEEEFYALIQKYSIEGLKNRYKGLP